jgi:site-specific DNA-methyltransferase (adenine-specific)
MMMIELNKIYNEDCLEGMKRIPDKSIDMILCDLPYGTTACKWDTIIPFEPLWEQYERVIKDNGAIVLTSDEPFTSQLINSNIENLSYEWMWEKSYSTGFMNAKKCL